MDEDLKKQEHPDDVEYPAPSLQGQARRPAVMSRDLSWEINRETFVCHRGGKNVVPMETVPKIIFDNRPPALGLVVKVGGRVRPYPDTLIGMLPWQQIQTR